MDRIAGLQDLQDRLFWLSCGLTMDRMEGQIVLAQLWVDNGQDGRMAGFTEKVVFKLSWALTMDRITGFRDLQDKGSANNGQDYKITGFTGQGFLWLS